MIDLDEKIALAPRVEAVAAVRSLGLFRRRGVASRQRSKTGESDHDNQDLD
jgi:hypothetical protein